MRRVGCISENRVHLDWYFLCPPISMKPKNTLWEIVSFQVYNLFFIYTFVKLFISFQGEILYFIERQALIVFYTVRKFHGVINIIIN